VLFEIGNVGKKFAKAPDSALVKRIARGAALEPERLQCRWVRVVAGLRVRVATGLCPVQLVERPSRKKEFQQVAAGSAAEILARGIRRSAARNAAEFRGGFRILSDRQFALSPEQKDMYIIRANRRDRRERRDIAGSFPFEFLCDLCALCGPAFAHRK